MSVIIQKGSGFTAQYASTDFPSLTTDWVGTVSLYRTYPGVAALTKALVRTPTVMTLALTADEILLLDNGLYTLVSVISNPVLGVTITTIDYAVVAALNNFPGTMCKLHGVILKPDGTPAGKEDKILVNTVTGTNTILGWTGVEVKVALAVADANGTNIIGTELVTAKTDATGYFEVFVIQGLTVIVACPSFGKSVSVNTTAQTNIDLSINF